MTVNTSQCDDKTLRVCGAAHPRLPLLLLLLPLSGLSPLFLLQAVLGFRCCINVLQLQVHRHVSPQPAPSPKEVRPRQQLDSAAWKFHVSPSGFVVQLVFQLSDFFLDDAYSFSVYEHSVLLKNIIFVKSSKMWKKNPNLKITYNQLERVSEKQE